MPTLTKSQLLALVAEKLADNTTKDIEAAELREVLNAIVDGTYNLASPPSTPAAKLMDVLKKGNESDVWPIKMTQGQWIEFSRPGEGTMKLRPGVIAGDYTVYLPEQPGQLALTTDIQRSHWLEPVDGFAAQPTGSEADGARYIVQADGGTTGPFDGHAGDEAERVSGAWTFRPTSNGDAVRVKNEADGAVHYKDNGVWSVGATSMAGTLPIGNTLFVDDASGNDATGERGNLSKQFKTLAAAIAAAQAGDVIEVLGAVDSSIYYDLPASIDMPLAIRAPGAAIRAIDDLHIDAMFYDVVISCGMLSIPGTVSGVEGGGRFVVSVTEGAVIGSATTSLVLSGPERMVDQSFSLALVQSFDAAGGDLHLANARVDNVLAASNLYLYSAQVNYGATATKAFAINSNIGGEAQFGEFYLRRSTCYGKVHILSEPTPGVVQAEQSYIAGLHKEGGGTVGAYLTSVSFGDQSDLAGFNVINNRAPIGLSPQLASAYGWETPDVDPGAGAFRFNSTTFASITRLNLSTTDNIGTDMSAYLAGLTSGELVLRSTNGTPATMVFRFTAVTAAVGFVRIAVVPLIGKLPTRREPFTFDFRPASTVAAVAWGGITGLISDQGDLAEELAAKANTADLGTAAVQDVEAFDAAGTAATAVDAHEAAADPHTQYQKTAGKNVANGYAGLDATGKVPAAQIPAIAITDYLGGVASQAAMLALVGQKGDWATRTDLGTVWIITGDDPSLLSGWTQVSYPASPVQSVAGRTGAVVIAAADVSGLDAAVANNAAVVANTAKVSNATHTGDVTGDVELTIGSKKVTNAHMANMPGYTIKGNNLFGTTGPRDLTVAQVRSLMSIDNVDNTSDANKPVSTAQAAAISSGSNDAAATAVTAHVAAADPHTQYQKTAGKNVANGYAGLDATGKVPAAQVPAIAITDYLGGVASQAAMLALVGQKGDWATRTDLGTVWIITGDDPSLLSGWTQVSYPASPVQSVAGRTGAVVIAAADVSGLDTDIATAIGAEVIDRNNAISDATAGLVDDRGPYDASGNLFPAAGGSGAAGAVMRGDIWTITVAGSLDGVPVAAGDSVRALADGPGQTAAYWLVDAARQAAATVELENIATTDDASVVTPVGAWVVAKKAVGAVPLTGIDIVTAAPVAATDTPLVAMGKLQAQLDKLSGAKWWRATINQVGTDAPTIAGQAGTISITFARADVGQYTLTAAAGTFTSNKTRVLLTNGQDGAAAILTASRATGGVVGLKTYDAAGALADGQLTNCSISIIVDL